MGIRASIRPLVQHCDLEERLPLIPATAQLRGLYFKNLTVLMREEGLIEDYSRYYPESHSAIKWYPISEFLERLAVAGALLAGPENVHEGMQSIARINAVAFTESLLGQTMVRLLARNPQRLLRQASNGRRQSCRYGRWTLDFPEPGRAVMHMFEEYLWIESYVLGAAQGTMRATNLEFQVEYELDSPFQGRHIITWQGET